MDKKEVAGDYNATAGIYDLRYEEEQLIKIGFILGRLKPGKDDIVIDAGCGTGFLLERLRGARMVVGLDSSLGMLNEAKGKGSGAELVLGDVEDMPFRNGCCDLVFSVSVLQLLDNPENGFREGLRILKKGGQFAVTLLKKVELARNFGGLGDAEFEILESESMKDVFLFGWRT